jgi:8-oxo-dGTP pyrophosphatase MutT (NUDIX family)
MPDITRIAGVLLRDEQGRYLLVQEAKAAVRGLWNWPAGHVDPGETLQQAAAREAKEETGYHVRITDEKPVYVGPGHGGTTNIVHLFRGEITAGNLKHQPGELLDARWFGPDEVKRLDREGKTRGQWVRIGLDLMERSV